MQGRTKRVLPCSSEMTYKTCTITTILENLKAHTKIFDVWKKKN